jgi:transposase
MNAREQRGLVIAAICNLSRNGNGSWLVPSQTTEGRNYEVDPDHGKCTCPDCQESGLTCKHQFAVKFTIKRELDAGGNIVETKLFTFMETKKYRQDWRAYNLAQSVEKKRFQVLLQDLCRNIEEPEHLKRGPKPHTRKDSIFAMAFKVYCMFSSRRSGSDFTDAHQAGFLSRPVPGMKVNQFFENKVLTPILKKLIVESAAPLSVVETCFAVDSTGFATDKFVRWYDHKYGITRKRALWVKAHISCGVKTNVITAVRILDKDAADCPQFKQLVRTTAKNFGIDEVSADSAYSSQENFQAVSSKGGTGFIAFKKNATGSIGGLFEKMLGYFKYRQEEFLDHYHKRSNIESTFSAVKRKFGDSVRSKTETAMVNEVLCKFLCHNLCCLIQEQCELGIEPEFWKEESAEVNGSREVIPIGYTNRDSRSN